MTFEKEDRNPPPPRTNGLEDRDLLILLLHEYSEKLIEKSRSLLKNKVIIAQERSVKRSVISFLDSQIFDFAVLFLLTGCSSLLLNSILFGSSGILNSNNRNAIVLLFIMLFFLVTFSFTKIPRTNSKYSDSEKGRKKEIEIEIEANLLERDARLIANQLESAMRLAAGISDQAEVNLIKRLEWDLRLTDASHALEYYYSVTELESKSKPQKRSKKNGIDRLDMGNLMWRAFTRWFP
jgi:hypothetical protein